MKNFLLITILFLFSFNTYSQIKTKGRLKVNVKKEAKALERDGWNLPVLIL